MRNLFFLLLAIMLILTACGTLRPAYRVVAEATLKPGDAIPAPTGEVILSLTGKIGVTNAEGRLDFDMTMLEQLGLVEYAIDDPEYRRVVTLRGPLLKSVLDLAQVQPDATELLASALNRYKTILPLTVNKWPVMIATWRDGQRLPFEEKGPIQIAFPNKQYTIDPTTYNPMYVWHLREIVVR